MGGKGELEFVIPITLDALQEAPSTRQYAVTYISSGQEIIRKLQECQSSFRQQGSSFVCDGQHFDALYSILWHFKELDSSIREKAFDLMVKVLGELTTKLANLLDDIASLDTNQRRHWLNNLKMNTFIAVYLTEAFESHHNKPSQDALLLTGKGRKRGGGGAGAREDGSGAWEEQRTRVLLQLYSLMQHPLHRLCTPPVMEEDYVNLVSNCCYKIMETPSLGLSRMKSTRDSLFQIIGSLVNRFNHGLACSLKIMQLVQHFEHLVSVCANGLALLVNSFGCITVVSEVVREIAKMDLGCLESVSLSSGKDSATVRNYTQFLMELAELVPQAMVPSLPLLFTFLDNDNYSLRNCMLCMMGALVRRVLSREDLDEKSRDLRDNCLDCIEDHLMDVNAFVRSKVVQVILELVEAGGVPLSRQQRLLELTVARLMDKSASVRKNSLCLLTTFLKQNPFAAKLPLADLQQQHEIELGKLNELCPEPLLQPDKDAANKLSSSHTLWQEKIDAVIAAVKDVLDEDSDAEDYSEDALSEDCTLNDAVSSIATSLETGKMHRAAVLLSGALEAFHGATVLSFESSSSPLVQISSKGGQDEELSPDQLRHVTLLNRIFLSSQAMTTKNNDNAGEEEEAKQEKLRESDEVTKQRKFVAYLKDSVGFAKLIQAGLPLVVQLLSSKIVSDVLEAIKFFVAAFEFGVLDAMSGVREMLVQIWSREQQVQTAVVEAYRRLYIKGDSSSSGASTERTRALHIVRNLTALTTGATLGELASLEEIIAQFMAAGDLSKSCITLLWERFTFALPDTTSDEAKAALTLLSMAANSEPSIVSSNIGVVVSTALGEKGAKDFSLVKEACIALSKIATVKPKTDAATAPYRLEEDNEIFTQLSTILVEGITRQEDKQYSPMAVQAITTIYSLAEHPDIICGGIIQQLCDKLNKIGKTANEGEDMEIDLKLKDLSLPTFMLSRFLVLVGRVAIRQLVHLDTFVFSELKRRSHLKEEHENEKKQKKKSKKKKEEKNKRKSLMTSATEASMLRGSSQEGDIDEELGMLGAVADDMEAEYIRNICDKELVNGDNLLGLVMPQILCVCANPSKYPEPELRAAAALALSNCMMVSADCCESNLQLLFTILEKSEDPVIRGNTIIALGDLSFRFPNLVEPWTPRLYARLGDECCSVRHNTITVLTHLILNDMVKVKGQISDIALRITDEEPRISGLAKLFFTELGRKANALYNVLPDIISRLSDPEADLEEYKYRTIIAHIFSLIQKDKQVEGLVEKLCHRLQGTTAPRQWRDITYCLSLLQYNEKCVRKLGDLFSCYCDKLHEPDVHKMFGTILSKARKLSKPETKTMIEELEAKIEDSHEKGVEEQNLVDKAAAAKRGRPAKQGVKRSNVRMAGQRRRVESSDSEEDVVMSDSGDERPQPAKKTGQRRRVESSDSEKDVVMKDVVMNDSGDERPQPAKKTAEDRNRCRTSGRARVPTAKAATTTEESSAEESSDDTSEEESEEEAAESNTEEESVNEDEDQKKEDKNQEVEEEEESSPIATKPRNKKTSEAAAKAKDSSRSQKSVRNTRRR